MVDTESCHSFHADSTTDATDAIAKNIDVQSYKKLLEKSLFNDLSSPGFGVCTADL